MEYVNLVSLIVDGELSSGEKSILQEKFGAEHF